MRCGYVVTFANAWSNLFYLVAALYLHHLNAQKRPLRSDRVRELLELFPMAAVHVGWTSFAYHASYTFFFQWFDFVGMFIFLALPITINLELLGAFGDGTTLSFPTLERLTNRSSATVFYYGLIVVFSALVFVLHSLNIKFQLLVAVMILIALAQFAVLLRRDELQGTDARQPLIGALLSLIVAGVASGSDQAGLWCQPESLLQGHAVWHLFSAVSMVYLYRCQYLVARRITLEP